MTGHLGDWANLLIRWIHLIAGIGWIGSSFYFIWLDRALSAPVRPRPGVEGELWMVHSGGFYQVEKRRIGPGELPAVLHWFKWEALLTWISGIALLVLIYYLGGAYLLDPSVSRIGRGTATALGVGVLVIGWIVYDALWRSRLADRPDTRIATAISLVLLAAATIGLCRVLSGRAAYMHVGTLLGTVMVANVWMRILPAQRAMIAATAAGRQPDFTLGERAKRRSVHNSYMTFPLLFIMFSNHYPATYGSPFNWLILLLLIVAGAAARHTMIADTRAARWAVAPAALALGAVVVLSAPGSARPAAASVTPPRFADVRAVIDRRCLPCHSAYPTDSVFGRPPLPGGVAFDTPEAVQRFADRIRVRAVETQTMPLANKTGMTPEERELLARWIAAGAPLR
jgi:uncharacterized membrane protein